jgi:hypothetical protein
LTLEAFVFEAGRGSMAEKVEFPPRLRVCPEYPGEMGFSKWPTRFVTTAVYHLFGPEGDPRAI